MKNAMKVLALVLAIVATAQTLKAYAQVSVPLSADEEAYQISRLMQLKSQMDAMKAESISKRSDAASLENSEFPSIKTEADFKDEFVTHTLRYIKAINAEDAFTQAKKRAEFSSLFEHESPGV